jgi:hypothetical protein
MSSQKWLPVAMTENQTHGAQRTHNTFAHRRFTSSAIVIPTISASAEWRLGIAAYGFEASCTRPLPWLRLANRASVSTKPKSGNIRGGAVGRRTYPASPITFASITRFRKRGKTSFRRR